MNDEAQNQDRRQFLNGLLASLAVSLLPFSTSAFASKSPDDNSNTIKILQTFLEKHLLTHSIQCGTRWGDGVPKYSDVESFLAKITKIASDNTQKLDEFLFNSRNTDLTNDNIMVVDGWVLAKTEVLAAASYVLLTQKDCSLPG